MTKGQAQTASDRTKKAFDFHGQLVRRRIIEGTSMRTRVARIVSSRWGFFRSISGISIKIKYFFCPVPLGSLIIYISSVYTTSRAPTARDSRRSSISLLVAREPSLPIPTTKWKGSRDSSFHGRGEEGRPITKSVTIGVQAREKKEEKNALDQRTSRSNLLVLEGRTTSSRTTPKLSRSTAVGNGNEILKKLRRTNLFSRFFSRGARKEGKKEKEKIATSVTRGMCKVRKCRRATMQAVSSCSTISRGK